MPTSPGVHLTKAQIFNVDTGKPVAECQFNPNELSIDKTNKWEPSLSTSTPQPSVHFQGEGARTMTLNLIFDSYEQRDDVRNLTRSVVDLTESHVDDNRSTSQNHKRPPHVMFTWGKFHTFPAVITSIRQNFTLFLEDGLPARATLTVSLQEVLGVSIKHLNLGQNPTSRAAGASRVREVHLGDTIDLIAAQELGSATAWRRIADANNLDDPRRLRPGQALLIPVDR